MSTFEINRYTFLERECPKCHVHYIVRCGGQKSGMSPAVHIESGPKGKVIGYCSSRCMTEALGEKFEETMAYRAFKDWGLDYDAIFPIGYLGPGGSLLPVDE